MKKVIVLVLAVLSILTFSCKKSSNDTVSAPVPDYYQLKVGNYWVFQHFTIDSNGIAVPENKWDSVYIEKDTLIRGYKYYKEWQQLLSLGEFPYFLRDSSGYLINNLGTRLCSDNNFKDTLYIDAANQNLFMGYLMMTGRDSLVTIPAGTFASITSRMKEVPAHLNDPYPIRYAYNVYGKNIGMIKSHNFFYISDQHFEERLVRYKVQ